MAKDSLVHVEKTPIPNFGHGQMRNLVVSVTGLVGDLPKTVGTGCGRRRKLAQTSQVPEHVTCPECRSWGRSEALKWADMAEAALTIPDLPDETRNTISAQAAEHRETAKRFEG